MNVFKKILSRNSKAPDPPSPLLRAVSAADPVFVCDTEKQSGVLRLRRGKWAGRSWAVRLHCCESPLCACNNVDFYCIDMDQETPEHAETMHFGLDVRERTPTADTERGDSRYAPDLAKAAAAEFGDKEWQSVYEYLLVTKRQIIRSMDVAEVSLPESPDDITADGSLVGFGEIFPFSDGTIRRSAATSLAPVGAARNTRSAAEGRCETVCQRAETTAAVL